MLAFGLGFGLALGLGFLLELGFDLAPAFGFGALLPPCLLPFSSGFFVGLLLVEDGLGNMLTGFNSGGIAGDMTDEPLTLGGGDYGCVQLLGQFGGGELGEGAREFGFVRQTVHAVPAAEAPEGGIDPETRDQVPCGGKVEYGFGKESGGQGRSVFRRAAGEGAVGADSIGSSGVIVMTAVKSSIFLSNGPTATSSSGNSSC